MKEWKKIGEDILVGRRGPLKVFLLGATDTGKTTFATFLANLAAGHGLRVAAVDADLGQSEIGPPGCVGMGVLEGPVERLRDVPEAYSCFVGSNSPELLSFTTIAAAKMAVEHAIGSGADVTVIDTTGLVWGRTARFLKNAKIDLLRPTHVVALQRDLELEHLLRPWDSLGSPDLRVIRAPVSPRAIDSGRRDMRTSRERMFRQYLATASPQEIDLARTSLFRTTYLTGRSMDESQVSLLKDDLHCDVVHAEWLPDGIFIIARGYFDLDGLDRIKEREGVPEVFLTKAERFENLLVGLLDHDRRLLGVGSLAGVDWRRATGTVWTPLDAAAMSRLAGLEFGILKVGPGGEELGRIHPNDI